MDGYILNLTNTLISANDFDKLYEKIVGSDEQREQEMFDVRRFQFLRSAYLRLLTGAVARMKPETLGKIMGSLSKQEVSVVLDEVDEMTMFSREQKGPDDTLRDLTALCLAYIIEERLRPEPRKGIPPYWLRSIVG